MRKPRLTILFILIWGLPWLACNLPQPKQGAAGIAAEALRQTMQAGSSGSEQDLPDQTNIPAPQTTLPAPDNQNPGATPANSVPTTAGELSAGVFTYSTQSGDTLQAVAARFGVEPEQIISDGEIATQGYLALNQVLYIPWELGSVLPSDALLPDSEVIYSPTAADFDLPGYVQNAGGYLSVYSEMLDNQQATGIEIIQRVASQSSINPRLLLAFLEFRSGWVSGYPAEQAKIDYPIGFYAPGRKGLYQEMMMTATQLNVGYYGWRQGSRLTLKFPDQKIARLSPSLNSGSAALQHLFSKFYRQEDWRVALYAPAGFAALYIQMFGDPWLRDASAGPIIPQGLAQPALELPFAPGERWSLTGGAHNSWDSGTPRGALDFSPVSGEAVCAVSRMWATAVAPGVITRAERNLVALDLDGDGFEGTGWVIVYYHIADSEIISPGGTVRLDDRLGHPSCEGGDATGKHIHIARKYNGEWLPADGAVPFVLSGWRAVAEARNYQGSLEKDGQIVTSNPGGNQTSIIIR